MHAHAIHYRYSSLGSHSMSCSCGAAEIRSDLNWTLFQLRGNSETRIVACRECGYSEIIKIINPAGWDDGLSRARPKVERRVLG